MDVMNSSAALKDLRKLVAFLEIAKDEFSRIAPDHGRSGVVSALAGAIWYIQRQIPERPELLLPIKELLGCLQDLDNGNPAPLLKPAKINHRPVKSRSESCFRSMVTAATEFKRRSGLKVNEAAEEIARQLNRLGYRDEENARFTAKRVLYWRYQINEAQGTEDRAAAHYSVWLMLADHRYPDQPQRAAQYLLKELPRTVLP